MPLKALIMISGVAIGSAVAALPVSRLSGPSDDGGEMRAPGPIAGMIVAKGDRLRLLDPACTGNTPSAACADIYGIAEGPSRTVIIERRVGTSTSVLVRLPVLQNRQSWRVAIAEN